MAFANIRTVPLGGGLRVIYGDFTASVGGGSQTYAVAGGRILGAIVNPQLSSEPVDFSNNLYSTSVSTYLNTLTIYGNAAITAGSFIIFVDAGG